MAANDWFHWIFSNGFAAFGVVVAMGMMLVASEEWQWLWPKSRRDETSAAIRAGRVIHWAMLILAAMVLALGIGFGMTAHESNEAWAVAGVGAGGGAILTLIGRAIRYILANE